MEYEIIKSFVLVSHINLFIIDGNKFRADPEFYFLEKSFKYTRIYNIS